MKLIFISICVINIIHLIFKCKEMKFDNFNTKYNILNRKFKILDISVNVILSILLILIFWKEYINCNLVFLILPILFLSKYGLKEYGLRRDFIIEVGTVDSFV